MNSDSLFRFVLILGDSNAKNFKSNLSKLVCAVLYDFHNVPKTAFELVAAIKSQYLLEFSEEEIRLSANQSKRIIVLKKDDPLYDLYSLRPEEYQKMENKVQPSIEDYIDKFISTQNKMDEMPLDAVAVKKIIYDFLYKTFDADASAVLELIDRSHRPGERDGSNIDLGFALDEKKIINSFLDWDFEPKNDFIMRLISACFDYCMLTVKKDLPYIGNALRGKNFYFDTNIIFRLIGINKMERKQSMDAFVNKCRDAGINIYYTNYTNFEISSTIDSYVDDLKQMLGSNKPLSVSAIRSLSPRYTDIGFYEEYDAWCKIPGNVAGDYESYKDYLKKKVRTAVKDFELVTIDNFELQKEHGELAREYSEYKRGNHKRAVESSINIDITNYLYMLKLNKNKNGQASDFFDLNNYFITADHCLTEGKEKAPGDSPYLCPSERMVFDITQIQGQDT